MNYGIKYAGLEQAIEGIYNSSVKIDVLARRLEKVKSILSSCLDAGNAGYFSSAADVIHTALDRECRSIGQAVSVTKSTGGALDVMRLNYLLAERRVYQNVSGGHPLDIGGVKTVKLPFPPSVLPKTPGAGILEIIPGITSNITPDVRTLFDMLSWGAGGSLLSGFTMLGLNGITSGSSVNFLDGTANSALAFSGGQFGKENEIREWTSIPGLSSNGVYDPKTGQLIPGATADYAKKVGTIAELEALAKIEASALALSAAYQSDVMSGSASLKLITAEAHAKANAGLYIYDKDGKLMIAPSIGAEIGASFALLTAAAQGRAGIGDFYGATVLGAYGNAEVSLGKVEAKVGASASIFNADGEFCPEIKARASAEAILAEAKAAAGITVLGIDAGVNASVNFGVGAHAEIGLVNGKFVFDVGVALGVGASLGFEIDVSGAVKAITGTVQNAMDGAVKAVQGVSQCVLDGVNKATDGVKNVVTGVAQSVANAAASAVNTVSGAATTVVNAVTGTAQAVGNAVTSAATTAVNAISSTAQSVGNAVGNAANAVGNAVTSLFKGW